MVFCFVRASQSVDFARRVRLFRSAERAPTKWRAPSVSVPWTVIRAARSFVRTFKVLISASRSERIFQASALESQCSTHITLILQRLAHGQRRGTQIFDDLQHLRRRFVCFRYKVHVRFCVRTNARATAHSRAEGDAPTNRCALLRGREFSARRSGRLYQRTNQSIDRRDFSSLSYCPALIGV